jgi:heme-degrading monooxygenase HmoA
MFHGRPRGCKIWRYWQGKANTQGYAALTNETGTLPEKSAIAVIFIAMRSDEDEVGYARAALRMDELAAQQPGYLGIDSVRGADGLGLTVSYWVDEASALDWKTNAEHVAVRALGRDRWYRHYRLIVTQVFRSYAWVRPDR